MKGEYPHFINPFAIEHSDILFGPSSVVIGSDALRAVILCNYGSGIFRWEKNCDFP